MTAIPLLNRVTCPYVGCRRRHRYPYEGPAERAREQHMIMCPHRPRGNMESTVEQTWSSFLLCRNRPRGCAWHVRFGLGECLEAEQRRRDHEAICERRLIA